MCEILSAISIESALTPHQLQGHACGGAHPHGDGGGGEEVRRQPLEQQELQS